MLCIIPSATFHTIFETLSLTARTELISLIFNDHYLEFRAKYFFPTYSGQNKLQVSKKNLKMQQWRRRAFIFSATWLTTTLQDKLLRKRHKFAIIKIKVSQFRGRHVQMIWVPFILSKFSPAHVTSRKLCCIRLHG